MDVKEVQKLFKKCFHDANVFKREPMFEASIVTKEGQRWLALAAGIGERQARSLFPSHSGRASRAQTPVSIICGGELAFVFVVRPERDATRPQALSHAVADFAPGDGVPFLRLREGSVHARNLPQNRMNLANLYWELAPHPTHQEPGEAWLKPWKDTLGFNPAHAPSHLHVNSRFSSDDEAARARRVDTHDELRLAVGIPNPLALILSLAAWVRACSG